ncbi:MAG: anthranilate synthase component I family protein [Lewinellaceae bacterium]|nr:anthranilate synthase component I family protein [Lewinellaceae bacterium]
MERKSGFFPIEDTTLMKQRLLQWADGQEPVVVLDSNGRQDGHWDFLLAAGAAERLAFQAGAAFAGLKSWQETYADWLFGFLGYDLKNELERLASRHFDGIGLPDMAFFRPQTVVGIRNGQLEIHTLHADPADVLRAVEAFPDNPATAYDSYLIALQSRIPREEYLRSVEAIRQHIIAGDVYEINFCQEYFAENAVLHPMDAYRQLNTLSAAPYSSFLRWGERYLLCGSPERFLQKRGRLLLSQPIKGTRKRGASPTEDEAIRAELASNIKDRAENVMIVDLVRNDLARNCLPGSVVVEELFGIHTFTTVHQMISSVRGELRPDTHAVDALRDAFPMGSMTGAPKVMAMTLIEQYERSRRGLYSGAVGYFDPHGDFDFNVVIRSILYNAVDRYVSVQVGGAIVYDSEPELEYEECAVKAAAMRRVLEG